MVIEIKVHFSQVETITTLAKVLGWKEINRAVGRGELFMGGMSTQKSIIRYECELTEEQAEHVNFISLDILKANHIISY